MILEFNRIIKLLVTQTIFMQNIISLDNLSLHTVD